MPEKALTEENFDDLVRRYRGGHFILDPDTDPKVIWIENIADGGLDGSIVQYRTIDGRGKDNYLSQLKIKEIYPDKGLYNIGRTKPWKGGSFEYKNIVYFQRKPRRQWMHGVRSETCWATTPLIAYVNRCSEGMWGNDNTPGGKEFFRLDVVNDIFFPWYPKDMKEAFALLEKEPYVALDRNFAMMRSWFDKSYLLLRHLQFIGVVQQDKILIKETIMKQEAQDLARKFKFGEVSET
jgi:hypothetical protein